MYVQNKNMAEKNGMHFTAKILEPKVEVEDYFLEFIVPPRTQINKKPEKPFQVKDIRFTTGLMIGVHHSGAVQLTSKKIKATLKLPKDKEMVKWSTTSCIKFYSQKKLLKSLKVNVIKKEYPKMVYWDNDWIVKVKFGHFSWKYWNDSVNRIRVCFLVEQATTLGSIGPVIQPSSEMDRERAYGLLDYSPDTDSPESNCLSAFFLSNELSDVKFTCEGIEFPSHKLILSSPSPVFNRMLNSSNEMTEAKEGKIQIIDMKSKVLKEMLRYMYCGRVENLEEISEELIFAANKYDLPKLKNMCEKSLIKQITLQNALSFYSLAESINAKALMEISYDCIKKNKSTIFENSQELLDFTKQCPEVIFQLLNL